MLGLALTILAGIGNLICLIIVVMRMFSLEGTMKGLLGLFCGLYAYGWGWMNQREHNLMDVMYIWTISILLGIVANLMIDVTSVTY
jgi:hypothetical protein